MRRPSQHVIEERAERLIKEILPVEWIFRSLPKDYGVDYEIEMVDASFVTGNRVWVQSKGTTRGDVRTAEISVPSVILPAGNDGVAPIASADYLAFPVAVKELQYALRCTVPLLLFVADLERNDVYWLPLQNEILCSLDERSPNWRQQKTAIVRVPLWNSLREDATRNFYGLRWYALEPARLNACVALHYYYHEFRYRGRLSGYVIGDGYLDADEEELLESLALANSYIKAALSLDALFGDRGIDFFIDGTPGLQALSIAGQWREAIRAAEEAIELISSHSLTFENLTPLLGRVAHAIELMSTAIAAYHGFRQKFLLTDAAITWYALTAVHQTKGPPTFPIRPGGRSRSSSKRAPNSR